MAKGVTKKKNRKLRRQIRKTVGALLMVSAIVVAAIPVPDVSAYPIINQDGNQDSRGKEKVKIAVTNDDYGEFGDNGTEAEYPYASKVPYVREYGLGENEVVYTSGDGAFKFVYIQMPDEVGKGAVILNYSGGSDTLTIPDTLEAYRQYTDNYSTGNYCLVSKDNELLYYEKEEQKVENGQLVFRTDNYMEYVTELADGTIEPGPVTTKEVLLGELDRTVEPYVYRYTQTVKKADGSADTTRTDSTTVTAIMEQHYYPCYYTQREEWKDIPDSGLFFIPRQNNQDVYDTTKIQPASTENHWKIVADVKYIGAEGIEEIREDREVNGETQNVVVGWKVGAPITKPQDGVFAETPQITNLVMSENIKGVGDYAFYGCTTLSSVQFSSNLSTLGNGAFADCVQLQNVSIQPNANLLAIGKDAFYNCRSLRSFTINDGLQAIGDCAFENSGLETINLLGSGKEVVLSRLGNHLFRGCTSLASVEFPPHYAENLDIDMFEGCENLQIIKTTNPDLNFSCIHANDPNVETNYPNCVHRGVDDAGKPIVITDSSENIKWAWDNFKGTVRDSFYFESPDISQIHTTANNNAVTYKYPKQELYERVEFEHDATKDGDSNPDGRSAKVIYQVDNSGNLVKFGILDNSQPDIITIPEKVGAFGISSLNSGSFNDNCYLKKVTIPSSVTSIGAGAFKGCHRLETVVFVDATTITEIGDEAFRTQVTNCRDPLWTGGESGRPDLYFVGAMLNSNNEDTVPFQYAMNGTSKVNNDSTEDVWITCHSGWPTALEVQYDGGEAQLVGYPRLVVRHDENGQTIPDLTIPADGDWKGWNENDPSASTYTDAEQWAINWVTEKLPFITGIKEKQEYADLVLNAARLCEGKVANTTPNVEAFRTAATNIVIPASVDGIEPGLFSGVYFDEDGNLVGIDQDEKAENADTYIQSVLINGVDEIDAYAFKDCTGLKSADIIGSKQIGDYAFDGCTGLGNVVLGTKMEDTGKRPFRKCENLTSISCLDGSKFSYKDGILYRTTDRGLEVVECLENRGKTTGNLNGSVGPDELVGVSSIKEEAFMDCREVASVDLSGTTIDTIPSKTFYNMEMTNVSLPKSLRRIEDDAFREGNERRFIVYFRGDPIYIAENAFEPHDPDNQTVIFQCLDSSNANFYSRSYDYITATEENVYQEFTVRFWNLPDYPAMTNMVKLDEQLVRAGEDAVPPAENPTCNDPTLNFIGWSEYTNIQRDMDVYATYSANTFIVTFIDSHTGETLDVQNIEYGRSAIPPTPPEHEGFTFSTWSRDYNNITENCTIAALYTDNSGDANRLKVEFYDWDGKLLHTVPVDQGADAIVPQSPIRAGYTFTGWIPADNLLKVTENRVVVANYIPTGSSAASPNPSGGNSGNNGGNTGSPSPSGGNGNNGGSSPSASPTARTSASPSATPTATPSNGNDVVKYTVSVSGGSGSGSYPVGAVVAINAYFMGEGQVFDKWTSSTAGVGFANPNASSTTFTMPASNVSVTATYKTGGAGTAATNASGGSSGGGSTVTGTANSNGTTVDVTRSGISNTNLAGATVSGATDNFVVKVTEDQAATDAATSALQARFGDLSRIKYFPMDISLYDSTGRTKIADTSGISVNLTLPLPDELVQYAGNNRIAAIAGGALEDLNARFTTIDGVPCINFTATHFSPYVIYVDTANLTEATIDSTPQTGDPIHPKWFLALGMACMSLILFFKRDKVVINTKTA